MRKLTTAAFAVALGIAWVVAPATAQQTPPKDKAEQQADKKSESVGDKMDRAWDKTKAKTKETKDKIVDTTKETKDKIVDKTRETKDKVVDKTKETKDKVADKMSGNGRDDVRNAQMALKDKGFNPGPIDGKMGPRTTAAVRDFQQKEGLTATGNLDTETRAKLNVASTSMDSTGSTAPAASPASEQKGAAPKVQQRQ